MCFILQNKFSEQALIKFTHYMYVHHDCIILHSEEHCFTKVCVVVHFLFEV